MEIRENETISLRSIRVDGHTLPIERLPSHLKSLLDSSFQGIATRSGNSFKARVTPEWNRAMGDAIRYARHVGWLPSRVPDLRATCAVLAKQGNPPRNSAPEAVLAARNALNGPQLLNTPPLWVVGLGLGIANGLRYLWSAYTSLKEKRKAASRDDSEESARAHTRMAMGCVFGVGSLASAMSALGDAWKWTAAAALTVASSAIFAVGTALMALYSLRGYWKCRTLEKEVKSYTENRNLTGEERNRAALRFLLDSAASDVLAFKRRSSWSAIRTLVEKGPRLWNQSLESQDAQAVVETVMGANRRKQLFYLLSAFASLVGAVGYLLATVFTAGLFPVLLYTGAFVITALLSLIIQLPALRAFVQNISLPRGP